MENQKRSSSFLINNEMAKPGNDLWNVITVFLNAYEI